MTSSTKTSQSGVPLEQVENGDAGGANDNDYQEKDRPGACPDESDILSTSSSNPSIDSLKDDTQDQQAYTPVALIAHETATKAKSNASSFADKSLCVPRNKRRGLFAQITLVPEFKDSRSYPENMKYFIVFLIAFASMIGPMGTSIIFPAIEDIKKDYDTTTMMVNVAVGIYLLSLGVFPLWWSSSSEIFGRRSIYIVSFTLYTAFGVGCALAPTINSFIGLRVLAGGCSASVQSVGAGTISDIYAPEKRGRGMGYYYLGPLMAPLLSPIIGSALMTRWGWRSTQWFLVILSGCLNFMIIFLLPETVRQQDNRAMIAKILAERRVHREKIVEDEESNVASDEQIIEKIASRISRSESLYERPNEEQEPLPEGLFRLKTNTDDPRLGEIQQNDLKRVETEINQQLDEQEQKKDSKWKKFRSQCYILFIKPTKSVVFLKYPPVALAISYSAVSFGILYLVNMTLEYEFARPPYNWKPLFVGLAYIPNSVSYIIASIFGGKWTDRCLQNYKKKHGFGAPESRISYNILSAVIVFPIALLILGWCFNYHEFWVTPLVGTALFGYASMMTIGPTVTYLVDSLPGRGATGVALNNLVRQILATVAVFIVAPIIEGINTGPMMTIFAGVITLWAVVLLVLKRKGAYWRENYDLQKLYDSLD